MDLIFEIHKMEMTVNMQRFSVFSERLNVRTRLYQAKVRIEEQKVNKGLNELRSSNSKFKLHSKVEHTSRQVSCCGGMREREKELVTAAVLAFLLKSS